MCIILDIAAVVKSGNGASWNENGAIETRGEEEVTSHTMDMIEKPGEKRRTQKVESLHDGIEGKIDGEETDGRRCSIDT